RPSYTATAGASRQHARSAEYDGAKDERQAAPGNHAADARSEKRRVALRFAGAAGKPAQTSGSPGGAGWLRRILLPAALTWSAAADKILCSQISESDHWKCLI